jgi:hypothetical protein
MQEIVDANCVLKHLRIDTRRWLVLCEEDRHGIARYLVGFVAPSGRICDESVHSSLDSARLDFETRAILHGWIGDSNPTAA